MWPFRKKVKQQVAPPPKYRDARHLCPSWRRGDLAECVRADWVFITPHNPKVGDILRVSSVDDTLSFDGVVRSYFLTFEGLPSSWCGSGFRKIVPVNEPADAKFTAELHDRLHHKEKI